MGNTYRISTIVTNDGERFSMIIDRDGKPDFSTTIYSVSILRARNLASATIENSLRAVLVLKLFLDARGIELKARFSEGVVLHLHELNSLVRICRLPTESIPAFFSGDNQRSKNKYKVLCLEKYRRNAEESALEVSRALVGTRLMYIRLYLSWCVDIYVPYMSINDPNREALLSAKTLLANTIRALSPRVDRRGTSREREGLAPGIWEKILKVIDPASPENPWCEEFVRVRNELMFLWLYHLGVRRGELLGVRIDDLVIEGDTIAIKRRADDPTDPRRRQPITKTFSRDIPSSRTLQEKTDKYIYYHRRSILKARKHLFLFISQHGDPLSLSQCNRIFQVLRAKCPDVPPNFSPHVLRHTCNDNYSKLMDENKTPEEVEKKTRAYLMGWKETSDTAEVYTRRHTRRKAQEASLAMQEKMFGGNDDQ